ncbi:PBECR2 nuclease fold domain-containing protein [Pedobacter sp. SL55]|uniref:PBECR2 nuclease fold domain-containing protein n=1 Tax=Pedobacter sp. SL55 TaxID=2995161 RepID=UPI00226D51F5|nr:PBECR2 nuclease fold domain-containing protein [Pedobacter sp. SL55]WAC40570.1 phage minor head protein [Pedobacter sp. SL55]
MYPTTDYRNTLKAYFQQNIAQFSGAKSLATLKTYNKLLLDENGEVRSWEQFKSKVADIDPILNVHHLNVERNDAIAAVQMADKWQGLKRFAMLEYSTVGDDRVRPSHAALDKLIIKTDDPLLDKIYPPKDHGCRCNMVPAPSGATPTDRSLVKTYADEMETKPYFKGNVGKKMVVYDDEHPYYSYLSKKSELQAERNYGMRSVKQIYDLSHLPDAEHFDNIDDAHQWWTNAAGGDKKGGFEVIAQNGVSIKFDYNFKVHVFEDNKDNRWSYIHNLAKVVQQPDEIWSVRNSNNVIEHRYIKYFDDYPMIVGANDLRAFSLFQTKSGNRINVEGLRKSRQGVLLYKNENR